MYMYVLIFAEIVFIYLFIHFILGKSALNSSSFHVIVKIIKMLER